MSFNVGPRTISATGGSIKRVGNYRVHTFPSELVTDGLVLNLDAGDPRSYPGSGTTWTDLSGNGNTGTLTNGPTYNNANGGSLVFDGTNDYISISNPTNFTGGTRDFSVSFWIKYSSSGNSQPDRIFEVTGGGTWTIIYYANNGIMLQTNDGSNWDAGVISTTGAIGTNTWRHVVFTRTGTIGRLYIDGTLNATGTLNSSINDTGSNFFVGGSAAGYFAGNISSVQFYSNKCLSPAEVAQNYDALKVRYAGYTNTFTPLCGGGSGKVEVLCVAGGGGAGEGGGGAGGLLYNSAFTINSNTGIGLTVGAGGTGSTGYLSGKGSNGGNSLFSILTSIGGGAGGAGNPSAIGNTGGSGGGTSSAFGAVATSPAAGTVGQGYSGGAQSYGGGSLYAGGGGGGAGGNGGIGNTSAVGGSTGGVGLSYAISGTSQFYAGGGGGSYYISQFYSGLGGSGVGGGPGIATTIGTNAIPNTGSGGGGSAYNASNSGNGSNGIVIVRYPATDYNVELLIVGGGGGGGFSVGSGGGAGGLLYYSSYPVSAGTKYTVTVGSGSTAMTLGSTGVAASNGNNSIFGPLVAYGGGGGTGQSVAYPNGPGGKSGGSGSGGTRNQNTPGQGVAGQGNAGGRGSDTAGSYGGGGGGGAGAVGGDGSGTGGGAGGNGLAFSISGISTYYAGGGGGSSNAGPEGAGGLGGGGAGTSGNGTSAVANTGGGGGGGDASGGGTIGGNGGSGITIIAYQGPQRGLGGTVNTTSRPGYTLHTFTTTGTDFFIP